MRMVGPIVRVLCGISIMPFATPLGAAGLNDTGQVTCYDATATATGTVSPGTSDPEAAGFDGQDCTAGAAAVDAIGQQTKLGGSNVRGRDYSKISNSGAVLPDSAAVGSGPNDWGCTRDNITGLIWELRSDDAMSRRYKNNRFTWGSTVNPEGNTCNGTAATDCDSDSYVSHVRSVAHCGANDWRLPTPSELESLLAYDDPAGTDNQIDRVWFPDLSSLSSGDLSFWTDAEAPFDNTAAWNVTFRFAWVSFAIKDSAIYTRLVRGATPASAPGPFSESQPVAGQPVVTDARTGLMWKKCAQGLSDATCGTGIESTMNWSDALTEAAGESYAGFSDWRLPTSFELSALRNYTSNQALGTVFSPAGSTAYWSSTTAPRGGATAILALSHAFGEFSAHADTDKTEFLAVRLVRGGSHLAAATSTQLDFAPDSFVLDAVSAPADTLVESNSITVQGVASATTVFVSGAADSEYSVNGGGFTRVVGGVRNGDTVKVRHRTGSTNGAVVATTLNIGGVTADFVSTAQLAVLEPPTIEFIGTPRDLFLINHKRNLVNLLVADHVLRVSDPDGSVDAGNLTVTVSSNNPGLFPLPFGIFSQFPYPADGSGTDPGQVGVILFPMQDTVGEATLTYTVTDSDGLSASIETTVAVEGNVRPTASYPDAIRLPADAEPGTYDFPNFVLAESPGVGEESSGQQVRHDFAVGPSVVGYTAEQGRFQGPSWTVQLDEIAFSRSEIYLRPVDNFEGVFPANVNCAEVIWKVSIPLLAKPTSSQSSSKAPACGAAQPHAMRIVRGTEAGVGLTVVPARAAVPQKHAPRPAGKAATTHPVAYRIRVVNNGGMPLQGVRITAIRPGELENPTWTCVAPGPGCVPASGSNSVDTLVDLELDEVAEILLSGEIAGDVTYLVVKADAELPDGVPAAQVPVTGFSSYFDVVSDAYLHADGFEID